MIVNEDDEMTAEDREDNEAAKQALEDLEEGKNAIISSEEMWNITTTQELDKIHKLLKEIYYSNIQISSQLVETDKKLHRIEKRLKGE